MDSGEAEGRWFLGRIKKQAPEADRKKNLNFIVNYNAKLSGSNCFKGGQGENYPTQLQSEVYCNLNEDLSVLPSSVEKGTWVLVCT